MKLFNCKVRLRADARDEVRKSNVTSAEIALLKFAHGDDAVLEIEEHGASDRSEAQERDRLEATYGERMVLKVFGAPQVRIGDEIATEAAPETMRKARRTRDTNEMAMAADSASAVTHDALA